VDLPAHEKRIADLFREAISKLSDHEAGMLHYYLVRSVMMTGDGWVNQVAMEAGMHNALAMEAMAVRNQIVNYQRADMRDW